MSKTSKSSSTLLKQFVTRMFVVLLAILGVSGVVQYYYLNSIINTNVKVESAKVGSSIDQGVTETDTASTAIEHQIDLKLKSVAQRISDRLGNQPLSTITNAQLTQISKDYGIAGVTIFTQQNGDIVGTKSTLPSDIGFGFKKLLGANSYAFVALNDIFLDKVPPKETATYIDTNTIILPITVSGSNKSSTPVFYKYGYYHPEGKSYIINPFIQANEVYQFTQSVGPDSWIKSILSTNKDIKEIAVVNPQVYANPSLIKNKYSMWKKLEYGAFKSETAKDTAVVVSMYKHPQEISYIEKQNGVSYYKMFVPTQSGKVIYVSLDYNRMSAPLKDVSLILLGFSLLSLLALFVLATRFFSVIYKNIQAIISQIKNLELGDFTARSEVKAKGELAELSSSTNHMAETLSHVIKETTKQAEKVQNLSLSLQSDANESVEKMYTLSVDLTSKAREENFEVIDFLDNLEEKLNSLPENESIKELITRVNTIRNISNSHTQSTTDITIILSDLLNSLQAQSVELADISSVLFKNMYKFKL